MTCRDVHELLAAYADQTLDAARRERIAAHLLGCPSCRRDLAETTAVRNLLGRCGATAAPSRDLAERLVAIAGPEAHHQLCLGRGGASGLPSLRRRRRNRALFVLTATAAGLLGAAGAVLMMAPDLPRVVDPDATPGGTLPLAFRDGGATIGATLATTADPCASYFCPDSLADEERTSVNELTDGGVELNYGVPGRVQLVVVEQRGSLAGHADAAGVEHTVWQSGEVVYCVMSTSRETTERAAQELPHHRASGGDARERLLAGWRELVGHRG